jgi:hypothetical protein
MKKGPLIFDITIIGFLLNLVWENVQAPLYKGYTNFWDHFMICFRASLIDAIVILLLYGLTALGFNIFFWIADLGWKKAVIVIGAMMNDYLNYEHSSALFYEKGIQRHFKVTHYLDL